MFNLCQSVHYYQENRFAITLIDFRSGILFILSYTIKYCFPTHEYSTFFCNLGKQRCCFPAPGNSAAHQRLRFRRNRDTCTNAAGAKNLKALLGIPGYLSYLSTISRASCGVSTRLKMRISFALTILFSSSTSLNQLKRPCQYFLLNRITGRGAILSV